MNEISNNKIRFFQNQLLAWYQGNARKFLWRNKSASNYERIISEVLLQRTKAETVNKFLPAFLDSYPDWNSLGSATEVELINTLKPLGLSNQRGKRLYKLAQELKSRDWEFPKDRLLVEEMPMMGQYLTNAYELFILKKPSPLLDVNMSRVLERYFSKRELVDIRYDKKLQKLAKDVTNHEKPIYINWAIIDLAAKVCLSKQPKCNSCPLSKLCRFFNKE